MLPARAARRPAPTTARAFVARAFRPFRPRDRVARTSAVIQRARALATVTAFAAALAACSPASVAEAEAQHDVAWLDAHESRAALEALGRLADHDAKAVAALAKRRGSQDAYHAAWLAHTRGAPWGDEVLRAALASPAELPLAVAELPARDPRLEGFAGDLEKGIAGAPADHAFAAAELLASLGPKAIPHLRRLLDVAAARDAVCRGLASDDAAAEAKLVLVQATPEARATPLCQKTLLQHVASDVKVLDWFAGSAEAPLVEVAAAELACPTLAIVWERVFASAREDLVPLEHALTVSMGRCATALDPVVARALPSSRRMRMTILHALDVDDAHAEQLEATCKQLPRLAHGRSVSEDVRKLAGDVSGVRCKTH